MTVNRAQMEKVERKVERRLASEVPVPFDLWDDDEQAYYVWVYKGGRCHGNDSIAMFQPRREQ